MKPNLRALVLTAVCVCFLNRPIHGAGKYLQVEYLPSTAANQLQIGVTYTLWDIEGAKMGALQGAAALISRQQPKLAISV